MKLLQINGGLSFTYCQTFYSTNTTNKNISKHKFTLQMHIKGYQRSLPYKDTIHKYTVTQLLQSIMWYIHVHTFFYIL